MRQSCNVFVSKNQVIVATVAMTTHGFEIDSEPVYRLLADVSNSDLGKAVLNALRSYRKDVSPPGPDTSAQESPVLRLAGFRRWSQLERISRNVFVEQQNDRLKAIPTTRPHEGGFVHQNALAVECGLTPEEIGKAVREASSRSL